MNRSDPRISEIVYRYDDEDFSIQIERVSGAGFGWLYAHSEMRGWNHIILKRMRKVSKNIKGMFPEPIYTLFNADVKQCRKYFKIIGWKHTGYVIHNGLGELCHLYIFKG